MGHKRIDGQLTNQEKGKLIKHNDPGPWNIMHGSTKDLCRHLGVMAIASGIPKERKPQLLDPATSLVRSTDSLQVSSVWWKSPAWRSLGQEEKSWCFLLTCVEPLTSCELFLKWWRERNSLCRSHNPCNVSSFKQKWIVSWPVDCWQIRLYVQSQSLPQTHFSRERFFLRNFTIL